MILDKKTKHHGTRFPTLVLSLIPSAVFGSVLGIAQLSRAQAVEVANTPVETPGQGDEASTRGSIGNHPDQDLVRKFLGNPPKLSEQADIGKTVGTNASRTDDPRVWTLMQTMQSDSINVGLGRHSLKGKLDWFKRGKEFVYDEALAKIRFLRAPALEDDSWVFVSGVPTAPGRFLLHSELTRGSIKVILGDRLLDEGVGYEVDYEQGIVTIVDKAIEEQGARYFIAAGDRSVGNHNNTELIRKLLRE
ncbi:hypothetical protein [Novipirellula artificiosorum]|nr:hypothetical protein [Novipirellula artificiosorum]